jgi:hypothetical protein
LVREPEVFFDQKEIARSGLELGSGWCNTIRTPKKKRIRKRLEKVC